MLLFWAFFWGGVSGVFVGVENNCIVYGGELFELIWSSLFHVY